MKLLATILLLVSTASADTWRHRVATNSDSQGRHIIVATINGKRVSCLFDSGSNSYGAIWLQKQTASKLGLRRLELGNGYHYYQGLNVKVGTYSRANVLSYEYDAAWNPENQCLIGDSFFQADRVLIDRKKRSIYW